MKKPWTDRFGDFMAGRGFYIVLFLCVAAIGISGYYLFSSLADGGAGTTVSNPVRVVVTPAPVPSPPTVPSISPVAPSVPPAKPKPSPSTSPSTSASTKPAPSAKHTVAAPAVFTWPVKGEVVDAFSPDRQRYDVTMADWRTHAGVDIGAEAGTPVKAASKGTVASIHKDDLLGTMLTIDHGNGLKSVYANLSELPTVSEGDSVATGDVIGAVGSTAIGESSQIPHLHLAFFKDDVPADPMKYLPSVS